MNERCGRPTRSGGTCKAWAVGPDGPACVVHLTSEERQRPVTWMGVIDYLASTLPPGPTMPACAEWPVTDQDIESAKSVTADDVRGFLEDWQQGRCAGCGSRRGLVLDHDHDTGLVRGVLCGGCNVHEAYASQLDDPMFVYRKRNPASMLGISVRYWSPIYGWAQPAPGQMPIDTDPAYLVAAATAAGRPVACRVQATMPPLRSQARSEDGNAE